MQASRSGTVLKELFLIILVFVIVGYYTDSVVHYILLPFVLLVAIWLLSAALGGRRRR